jgi:hypothetical protein
MAKATLKVVAVDFKHTEDAAGYVAPDQLQQVLRTADTKVITFQSEKRMQAYRRNLYSINKQGMFRYRTVRDEQSMWGIIIYRMV